MNDVIREIDVIYTETISYTDTDSAYNQKKRQKTLVGVVSLVKNMVRLHIILVKEVLLWIVHSSKINFSFCNGC